MIKRIIFDIDNTLITFPKHYEYYYQQVLDKYHTGQSALNLFRAIGNYEVCKKYDLYDINKMLEHVNQFLNLNLDIKFWNDYFEMYNQLITEVPSSVKDTLRYLKSKYELVALSNWFTFSQKKRLAYAGIIDYFDKILGADIVPMKPNEESFLNASNGLELNECVMVGDNLNIDIKVPYEMGMEVYYLSKTKKIKYPTIDRIEKLKELL